MANNWPPRIVVVGVDGSDPSIDAARTAALVALRADAKLLIVTAVRNPEGWWGVVGSPPPAEAMANAMAEAQKEVLDTTVAALDLDGVEWDTSEEIGDPPAALVNFCAATDADLLVVGRRGAGLIHRMVLGSVADRVAHDAPCPVLIVP